MLKDIYVDKGFSANAFAALIRNNLAISVVIFVVIGLVLLAVIILPILSKKRKKMDAADAEKLNWSKIPVHGAIGAVYRLQSRWENGDLSMRSL